MLIKQSSAVKVLPFLMVQNTDHITGKTGLTPTVTLSKNGAGFGAVAGAVSETGNGWYKVAANSSDCNTLGSLVLHAEAVGADPVDTVFEVVGVDPDDAAAFGLSRLDAAVTTRATPAQVQTELGNYGALKPSTAGRTLDVSVGGEAGLDWANVGSPTTAQNLSNTNISTTQVVASVTNGVTLTSGERTTLAGVIWNVLTSTLTLAGSIGKLLVDNIDAKISTRSSYAGGDTPGTTTLLARIASVLTITSGKVDINDKTGFGLAPAERDLIAAAEWNWAGSPSPGMIGDYIKKSLPGIFPGTNGGLFIAGSNSPTNVNFTGDITGNLNGDVTGSVHNVEDTDSIANAVRDVSNVSPAAGSLGADVKAGIGGGGGSTGWDEVLPGAHAPGSAGYILGHNLDAQVSTRLATSGYTVPPDPATIGIACRDTNNASPASGSVGDKINSAASAGDPWATTLVPNNSGYPAGTAGKILGDNLDVMVSTRLPTSGYTVPPTPTVIAQTTRDINNQTPATNSWGAATNAAASAGDPWSTPLPGSYPAGSAGKLISDQLDVNVASRLSAASYVVPPTTNAIAIANRDISNASPAPGSVGDKINSAASAGDPWSTVLPGTYGPGTAGAIIGVNIDAQISDMLTSASYVTPPTTVQISEAVRDVDNTNPAANSLGAAINKGTDPLANIVPGSYAPNTAGKLIGDNLDAKVSSRSTYAGTDTPGTTTLLTRVPSPITITNGKVDVNDKTGFSLDSSYDKAKNCSVPGDAMSLTPAERTTLSNAIWQYLTGLATVVGSMGKLIVDNLNATVGSRLPTASYVPPDNAGIASIKAKTDALPANPVAVTDVPTAAQNAAATRDVSNASPVAGSLGADIKAGAQVPSDPLNAQVPGSYPAGTLGNIVGTRLDVQVSTRLPTSAIALSGGAVTVGVNNDKTGYTLASGQETIIADEILKRDWQLVSGEATYSVLNALRFLRDQWEVKSDGTLVVYKENGQVAWTRTVKADPDALPIVGVQ